MGTDDAARGLQCFGLAVQLVAEALDVVHSIGDDDVIARQHPLYGRIFFRPCIFLGSGSVVDAARYPEGLIVDEVDFQPADTCVGTWAGDGRLEMFLQLQRPRRLPRRGIAADENELCASVAGERRRSDAQGHTGIFCMTLLHDSRWSSALILRLE